MSIVTRTGDSGLTGILGGQRLSKAHARIHAYGTVDELNALLGVIITERDLPESIAKGLTRLQHQLFLVGADLATPMDARVKTKRVTAAHVQDMEARILGIESLLPHLQWFILPGGSRAAALLHHARTVCRRAERWIVTLKEQEPINDLALIFLNRLGDLLFLLARVANREAKVKETRVAYA